MWWIILIILAVLIVAGIIIVGGRRARETQLDNNREDASGVRLQADQQASAAGQRANEVDPDVDN